MKPRAHPKVMVIDIPPSSLEATHLFTYEGLKTPVSVAVQDDMNAVMHVAANMARLHDFDHVILDCPAGIWDTLARELRDRGVRNVTSGWIRR